MDSDPRLKSLNQVLKWSVKESTKDGAEVRKVDPKVVEENKHLLDELFKDEYGGIEALRKLAADESADVGDRAEALEALEEYAQDLNFAVNFGKVGVLRTAVDVFRGSEDSRLRANAVWLLGTSMQDVQSVKDELVEMGVIPVLKEALEDENSGKVRAKGVMASSALLRNSPQYEERFTAAGGLNAIGMRLLDTEQQPRERAMFFLEHSRKNKCDYFASYVSSDKSLTENLLDRVASDQDEAAAAAIAEAVEPSATTQELFQAKLECLKEIAKSSKEPEFKRALLKIIVKIPNA
uniref:Nucleotide exchange factor Fes1 domain-containing protein n=1 Tax=Rhodosorus marinus TaxID=101924 RepID=A0A7S2ZKX1_9RHOD|mmetsp:Transcript_23217/g.92616  ORF Transcript_23217/g.92616 Transcript_23217/m.92616 type:complete len:294 (+) Transcript_23217:191-1072(+)|eukprot:CAMPEP_0113963538 /NCGR_PEP_ID=MMETSP0011_2-20120614/6574_1 /TAXON_ID=101924 /ORGANISM="Rhodosorus marinus" /LENGTH=293 /DNA_ID=CAMNT_0000975609 /DNA_START=90 /DNA_END=971 /DNA_ORIENTATION=+ /assembly_acc=CAM_ASM_000156